MRVHGPEVTLNPKAASRMKTYANRLDSGIIGTFAPSIPFATVILHLNTDPLAVCCLRLRRKESPLRLFSLPRSPPVSCRQPTSHGRPHQGGQ